ncbi:nitroreductase family protein [Paenibacillus crassostreae]|uniref:Putative NAD(P)H nitroreductase n=1 Tax=Paenibacillus crassostreae TaxID=1763538 RepID=A0A167DWD7_9BACL|nr:nitroreductase [Paenibacillus crassostreae]AOZ90980.1 nitroreductase [Paenibacillus crassostreae]OAB74857.1 nitroreductase [Paenibacillus crassostreae]
MELSQLIKERRSIHIYEDREVSLDLVKNLLDTAVWVPNHRMTQPWRFVIVHGEGRKRIAEIQSKGKAQDSTKAQEASLAFYNRMMDVPMYIAVVMKENPVISIREEDYASVSCIIQNFSLLSWEQGLGSVWKSYGFMYEAGYREALGIQPGEKVVGSIHVGYASQVPNAQPRTPASDLITVIDQA